MAKTIIKVYLEIKENYLRFEVLEQRESSRSTPDIRFLIYDPETKTRAFRLSLACDYPDADYLVNTTNPVLYVRGSTTRRDHRVSAQTHSNGYTETLRDDLLLGLSIWADHARKGITRSPEEITLERRMTPIAPNHIYEF